LHLARGVGVSAIAIGARLLTAVDGSRGEIPLA